MAQNATAPSESADRSASIPRYAVILKTYTWDAFVESQARRCQEQATQGDFFLSVDETRGGLGPIPFERVLRTNKDQLVAMGLANRFEKGSLLWWNPDYAHCHFFRAQPDYDFYIFLEYDAAFCGRFDELVAQVSRAEADLAAVPLREPVESWFWAKPHQAIYPAKDLDACLVSFTVISRRAMVLLYTRRLMMSRDPSLAYWPSAEAFLPTEIKTAGFRFVSLQQFGDTSRFDWYPPHWEHEVVRQQAPAFAHPVYGTERFVRWALSQGTTPSSFVDKQGPVRRALSPLPRRLYLTAFLAALSQSVWASVKARLQASGDADRLPASRMEAR